MAIQLRRGDYEDFDPQKMRPAEVAVVQHNDPNTSDGKAVYVAISPGDVKRLVSNDEVQDTIYNETEEIINQIEQGVVDTVAQAEAWVTGEIDGEPVPATDPTYHNNAKYYAEEAEAAAASLEIDDTLTQPGQAADAKTVGDEIADLRSKISKEGTALGNVAHITGAKGNTNTKSVVVAITPLQSGSGTPSASNVRPISGWTGVTVTKYKKNMLASLIADGKVPSISSGALVNANSVRSDYIPANANTRYCFQFDGTFTDNTTYIFFYDRQKNFLSYTLSSISSVSEVSPDETAYIMLRMGNSSDVSKVNNAQLEISTSPTEYEATTKNDFVINWSSAAGTVYGGELNVSTGVLKVTHGFIASYAGETINAPWISSKDVYAEGSSPSTGAQVVYPLSEALTYQVGAINIPQTEGINNYTANNVGTIRVKYITDSDDSSLPAIVKEAILTCFRHVAWIDGHGQDYYDALYNALYSGAEYPQLSVSYNPPEYFTLYIGEGVDILKNFLTVTLHTSESESTVVNDYDLTGSINGTNNTITVSYNGLTDTFVATAEQWSLDLNLIIGNYYLPGTTVQYDGTQNARATFNTIVKRLPVGTYNINCTNSGYLYGAQFIRTASPKLFETSARVQTEGTSATLWTGTMSKNWEISGFPTGWNTGSSTFTITDPEGFFTLNFKKSNDADMTASDKQAIQAAFTMTRTV